MKRPVVLKLGGELIESADRLAAIGKVIRQAAKERPLIVVHGGGREIDASLAQVGIPKRQVDGLRVPAAADLVVIGALVHRSRGRRRAPQSTGGSSRPA